MGYVYTKQHSYRVNCEVSLRDHKTLNNKSNLSSASKTYKGTPVEQAWIPIEGVSQRAESEYRTYEFDSALNSMKFIDTATKLGFDAEYEDDY